ncbi:flagellar assembly protein FliW [uncultured Helicobacter sp.]|uniref:flagellar assembly protein FliW n=1 Tax=uncultured Helicobacter sp. TaxID=175537 RepID=UPI001C3A41BC|nr:flagellar assembly protein FliW [Candidatus Helicobacter avicola]
MIFEVKSPILGFERVTRMEFEKIDELFMRVSNPDGEENVPTFTLVNPFLLRNYEFEIPTALKLLLDLDNCQNLLVANIMVLQNPIEDSTINFLAPLVFNFDNHTMAQVVLDSINYPQYSIAEPIRVYCDKDEATTSTNSSESAAK